MPWIRQIRTVIMWLHSMKVGTPQGLQASAPFFPSLTPPIHPFLHPSHAPLHTHIWAWFIFPDPASAHHDLYVYGHYWRWVIHFSFSPSSPSSPALFQQNPWVRWGISMTFFLFPSLITAFCFLSQPRFKESQNKSFFMCSYFDLLSAKNTVNEQGGSTFPPRSSLFIINHIFSSGDVSSSCWFEMLAPALTNVHVIAEVPRSRSHFSEPRASFPALFSVSTQIDSVFLHCWVLFAKLELTQPLVNPSAATVVELASNARGRKCHTHSVKERSECSNPAGEAHM